MNSTIDPEHLFKLGYFRSSYNGGGINHVLENRIGKTLYDIFPESVDSWFSPNWARALINVDQVIKEFDESIWKFGTYDVFQISSIFLEPTIHSEKEALDAFFEEINKEGFVSPFGEGAYSNRVGHFYPKGLNVRAIILGESNIWKKSPSVFVITEDEKGLDLEWYRTALKIVRETILYVLGQAYPENYGLSWSA
jgi:hypothetical protein